VIGSFKEVDAKVVVFNNFKLSTKNFNPFDPHGFCKDHYARVYYSWIHEACHWPEEDPWRYCYNSSRLNEPINMAVEWLEALKETTTIATTATTSSILV